MFKRRGKKTDEAVDQVTDTGDDALETSADATDAADEDGVAADGVATDEASDVDGADVLVFDRAQGPFDVSEVDSNGGRLDLGALWVSGRDGMELRLELDAEQQNVNAVSIVMGGSAVQLQAFAAPKTSGIWDDIRDEIAQSIATGGGTAQEKSGPLGRELMTRMPSAGPDGRTVFSPARFAGVDGPRWFLRAVFSGAAAIDEAAAAALTEVVRDVVVVRGDVPMAPRELLPLRLPEQPADADAAGADGAGDEAEVEADAPPKTSDLNPFERGPEITEVR